MAYKKVGWKDYPSTDTPINATNLDHMDAGILENAQTIGDKTKISGIGDGTVAGAIAANKSAIDANAEAIAQNTQSLTTFETDEIEFVGTVDKTKTGTSGYVVKNGNIVIVSFEFSFKTGYPFNGNAQIGILPFKAKHASYCGFACNLNNNQIASIYVKGNSIFLQTNNTIQENVTLRGGIIYFS